MPLQATSGAASYDAFGGGAAAIPQYIEDVFSTYLYTGNGSTQTITNGIDLSTKGGLVWIKRRDSATNHQLADTVRGATKYIYSNLTDQQDTVSTRITSFNSDGFSLGSNVFVNNNTFPFVSWSWAKAPKFFDVQTWTGTGSPRTIAHNLGSVPGFIIVKRTDTTGNWICYHRSLNTTAGQMIVLNLSTYGALTEATSFNSTAPTSTVFTVGTGDETNGSGGTFVAYIFAHDAGGFGLTGTDNVISCGSYTTDGSGNATINLGYEPQWLMVKASSGTYGASDWRVVDVMRGMSQTNIGVLYPNYNGPEDVAGRVLVPTATGFLDVTGFNNTTFIYVAIRRGPMKVPTSGTSVYNAISRTGTGATANVTGVGFPPDMLLDTMRSTNWTRSMWDRLRGPNLRVATNQTAAENSYTDAVMSYNQDGVTLGADGNFDVNASGYTYINWFFRRAPSFFDEVCYTGDGANNRTVTTNLGVAAELIICKCRGTAGVNGFVAIPSISSGYLVLDATTSIADVGTNYFASSSTNISFPVSASQNTNARTYVAYLFATCAGVSKVGSYTGTATTKQIDCGFTGGARFVLIKRTDSTGDWYVWDSARGIVSGNDSYLLLNSTAAEVTNTDYIDTYSAGFEISSTAPAAINASGGSFIFLAIA